MIDREAIMQGCNRLRKWKRALRGESSGGTERLSESAESLNTKARHVTGIDNFVAHAQARPSVSK